MAIRATAPFLWNGHGPDVLVVPKVSATRIEFIAFFQPKLTAFKVITFYTFDAEFVAMHWRVLAMAYVVGHLDAANKTPDRIQITDHNATARAPTKIVGKQYSRFNPWPPRLPDVDAYLGTRFCQVIAECEQLADRSSNSEGQHRVA